MNEFNIYVKIGTCSWKYDSWKGLIYSDFGSPNYLKEYARRYNTVEIDQWFWSLFAGNKISLPKENTVNEYVNSVPENFTFSVKVPNAVTMTHHYNKRKDEPLQANPYFLSNDLFDKFLKTLQPMKSRLGPLMFQFEYLNKQKMPDQNRFMEQFSSFIRKCPAGFEYNLEIRNPNYLNSRYFQMLQDLNIGHVFLQGYYMPPVFGIYNKFKDFITNQTVIRLHGPDRKGIEEITKGVWNKLADERDVELSRTVEMVNDLVSKKVKTVINVNNHYEGSAPLTIGRLIDRFNKELNKDNY